MSQELRIKEDNKMKNAKKVASVLVAACIIFLAGSALSENIKLNPIKPGNKVAAQITDEQQAILAVRKAKASVVSIVGITKPTTATSNGPGISVKAPQQEAVSGTGFVLEQDGLIVTNNHVVEDANLNYWVILADGSRYAATISGQDKFDDLAFLKIEKTGLSPAVLGDSSSLETGQTVFAIGNSLGRYENSVTRGVVSALGRALSEPGAQAPRINNLIQTDAAISNGNSGGPLINLSGEVVGMNTLIDTSGYSLSFSIPVNVIKDSLQQLKTFGKISRPFLGVEFKTIDQIDKLENNVAVENGAIINTVAPNTPAALAGIKPGDIVISVNGQSLGYNRELDSEIQSYQAGSQVMLKILRKSETIDLPVILGEYK